MIHHKLSKVSLFCAATASNLVAVPLEGLTGHWGFDADLFHNSIMASGNISPEASDTLDLKQGNAAANVMMASAGMMSSAASFTRANQEYLELKQSGQVIADKLLYRVLQCGRILPIPGTYAYEVYLKYYVLCAGNVVS